jgi:tRNA-binding protein
MIDMENVISWSDFEKIDMRVGTIITAEVFAEARKPAYKVSIDFGEMGIRKSSAQITKLYTPADLIGRQIIAVVNFPVKQIGPFMSECLIMGAIGTAGEITLLNTDFKVENGLKIG